MRSRASLALLLLVTLPACGIYFGGDDGDDDCFYEDGLADYGLRNPETGSCEWFGGGGGGCGEDLPLRDQAGAPFEAPDWGACASECEALTEGECWAAERCRAAYLTTECPPDSDGICDPGFMPSTFLGCWAIAPSGPAYERVACEALDAYECSRHNDCSANYADRTTWDQAAEPAPQYRFTSCIAEPFNGGACAELDCEQGYHCEETCYPCDTPDGESCPPQCIGACVPDVNQCPLECPPGTACVGSCPGCEGPGDPNCDAECTWECLPTPTTCEDVTCAPGEVCALECPATPNGGMGECRPVCIPVGGGSCAAVDCGPGYHCEEQCTPPDPCPPGQMCPASCGPVCVPDGGPGTCEAITDEMVCLASAPACRPLYTGTCWIDPNGQWQCVDTTFTRCETNDPAVPPQP